jgi:hypothetical protein
MPKYILDPCIESELWGIWHFIAQDTNVCGLGTKGTVWTRTESEKTTCLQI